MVIFAGGKFGENVCKTFHVGYISRCYSFFLQKGIWVLFSRGGNFREEHKSVKNAKITTFTVPDSDGIFWSPSWDWDLSNFPVMRSHGLTQAKYTWPCKHRVLLSTTLWRHKKSTPTWQEEDGNCFFAVGFKHFASRRKIIKHHIARETQESHPHVQDLQHPRLGKPRRGLQIMDTRMGIPRSFPQPGDRFY